MTGQAWKLTYTDSNGDEQIIAENGQDTGAIKIDRMRYILRQKNPWILKVFTDPRILTDFPRELTEFQGSEPEILFEEYDGSNWTTRGRFYSASEASEENEYAVQLLDFYHKLMKQEVTVTSTSTHIVDVLEKALPSGYVVDAPASGNVSGGYPSVDDYSAQKIQRRKVFREITRNYNWSLFFLPETDSNGDWKVRFEPDGYGGTVDTLDSSTDKFKFKNWKPPRNRDLVTKTRVEGVDSNGNKITATAENTSIRDKYLGTSSDDHNFEKFKVGYVQSSSEAQTIADNRLKPGPNATSVKDRGKISNTVYPQDVVNDSFSLVDSFRGIDDTYTCVKQENFYPANVSYIHLEFESEGLERAAEGEENLRDERARLYTESQTDVGNQSLTTGDALSNTGKVGGVGDANDRGDNLSNVAKTGGVGESGDRTDNLSNVAKTGQVQQSIRTTTVDQKNDVGNTTSLSSSGWTQVASISSLDNDNALYHNIGFKITSIGSNTNLNIAVVKDDESVISHTMPDEVGNQNAGNVTGSSTGDDDFYNVGPQVNVANETGSSNYTVHISTKGGASPSVTTTLTGFAVKHAHDDNIDTNNQAMGLTDDIDTNNQAMGLTDDIDTEDNLHGGGSGDDQHGGSTESNVNVETVTEDKTDR